MNRQAPYFDGNANPYGAYQMQQLSAQRMQENAAMNNFQGHPSSLPAVQENISDQKPEFEKQASIETHEQDMEIGYEDKPQPLTFEVLEKKFRDEIRKLTEEQIHAEDAENARHVEKIIEINNKYREKLSALRARQASRREEFLSKEYEERLGQYQQSRNKNAVIITSSNDLRGYVGPASTEVYRAYPPTAHFDSYREESPLVGRSRGDVGRVPYPQGRVYNNAGARF